MEYKSYLNWALNQASFTPKTYDRTHDVRFGGGLTIEASSAPEFLGRATLPNPEELFVASIASCLMLTFLYIAATKGLTLSAYQSESTGKLAKNAEGKLAVIEVMVRPTLQFSGEVPSQSLLHDLFEKAHAQCF
ncbi:MAG TPA: OsmC family protein, partial [Myxococcota bacterium]|nr:OsmC family protein [Myxococcota bacterium]